MKNFDELTKKLPGLKKNVSLARFTTFRIGGPADYFFEANTAAELVEAVKVARELKIPYFILAGGSNLLVSDFGFRGLVIKIRNDNLSVAGTKIVAGAGVKLAELVGLAASQCLTGMEFAAGIPGTVGGAVYGNAGAWRKNIGLRVKRVLILSKDDRVKWISRRSCCFTYRWSEFKENGAVILEVELSLKKGDKAEISRKMGEYLEKRNKQPKEPSAGSIFINPKPQPAGWLIQESGLKGKTEGSAQISDKHANFIINRGGAKAAEVIRLIDLAKSAVKKEFGVELKEEICLLGFDRMKKDRLH